MGKNLVMYMIWADGENGGDEAFHRADGKHLREQAAARTGRSGNGGERAVIIILGRYEPPGSLAGKKPVRYAMVRPAREHGGEQAAVDTGRWGTRRRCRVRWEACVDSWGMLLSCVYLLSCVSSPVSASCVKKGP